MTTATIAVRGIYRECRVCHRDPVAATPFEGTVTVSREPDGTAYITPHHPGCDGR